MQGEGRGSQRFRAVCSKLVNQLSLKCNSLMQVGTVGYTSSIVPVESVACFLSGVRDVVVEITPFRLCSLSHVVNFLPVSPI